MNERYLGQRTIEADAARLRTLLPLVLGLSDGPGIGTFHDRSGTYPQVYWQAVDASDTAFVSVGAEETTGVIWARFGFADRKRLELNAAGDVQFAPAAAHIADADGSLGDLTTKFNQLLAVLEGVGILATA